jgi:hypothetical protein
VLFQETKTKKEDENVSCIITKPLLATGNHLLAYGGYTGMRSTSWTNVESIPFFKEMQKQPSQK